MTTQRRDRGLVRAARLFAGVLCLAAGPSVLDAYGASAEIVATLDSFRERLSKIYCSCNNIEGLDLVFDLKIENRSPAPITLYAFVWAANDEVNPPERGLWPVEAVEKSLTETGELRVVDPLQGHKVTLGSGESRRLESLSILQPIGWYEGKRVRFRRLKVELWDSDGNRLLEEELSVPMERLLN